MADDWIPVRILLADDPAVVAVAIALNVDEDLVTGKLLRLWGWADQHTSDGNARSVTGAWVDRLVRLPGFAAELVKVGWLEVDGNGVKIPKFDRWHGNSGKARVKSNKRVSEHREMKRKCNANSVTKALPENRTEENRRTIPSVGAADDVNPGAEESEAITPTTGPKTHPKFAEVVQEFGLATTLGPTNRARLSAMLGAFGHGLVRIGLTEAKANAATNPIPYADTICNRLHAEKFQGRRKPTAANTPTRPAPDRTVVHE